jgi:tRNA U34 2-thiouridine synthase MnmA/TrmU
LYTHELYINSSLFNWIGGEIPPPLLASPSISLLSIFCRIRHLQPLAECEVSYSENLSRLRIVFHRPIRAVTRGQTAALYTAGGLICLGGGPIDSRGPSYQELGIPLPPILHPSGNNDMSIHATSL